MRKIFALGLGVPIALALALPVAPSAEAASTISITSVVTTSVTFGDVVGATVSIVSTCPRNARLNVSMTRAQISPSSTSYRLLSREFWGRGIVTRWLAVAPEPDQGTFPLLSQTIACVQTIRTTATDHLAAIAVKIRLWGPFASKAFLQSFTSDRVFRGRSHVSHTLEILGVSSKRMSDKGVSRSGANEIDGYGGILGPLRSGSHTELEIKLGVRAHF
jgi:hypothetical protein